jgi:hypothetical protein
MTSTTHNLSKEGSTFSNLSHDQSTEDFFISRRVKNFKKRKLKLPSDANNHFSYGRKNLPSDNVKNVINYEF